MKTRVFAQKFYVQNLCEKKRLDSLLLSDGSTETEVIGTMQYVITQQGMVDFCLISELKAIEKVLIPLLYLKSL